MRPNLSMLVVLAALATVPVGIARAQSSVTAYAGPVDPPAVAASDPVFDFDPPAAVVALADRVVRPASTKAVVTPLGVASDLYARAGSTTRVRLAGVAAGAAGPSEIDPEPVAPADHSAELREIQRRLAALEVLVASCSCSKGGSPVAAAGSVATPVASPVALPAGVVAKDGYFWRLAGDTWLYGTDANAVAAATVPVQASYAAGSACAGGVCPSPSMGGYSSAYSAGSGGGSCEGGSCAAPARSGLFGFRRR